MWDLLLQSAFVRDEDTRIVHPRRFIQLVRESPR